MSNMIDRKTAEAARRRVIQIDSAGDPDPKLYAGGTINALRAERAECCKLWNDFCAQETARLAAKPMRINPMVALFGG
jgi:hypothetical protein